MDLIIQLNFHFNQKSLEAMATELNGAITLDKVDLSRKLYKKALYEWIDTSQIQTALNQLTLFGSFSQIPKGYEATMILNEVKMKWDPIRKSFYSTSKLGIGTIGNIQVNKFVDGYIEIFKKRSGDLMTLYINLGDDRYYVFTYTKSVMQVSSSNPDFLLPIQTQKSSEQKVKVRPGEIGYRFLIGTKKDLDAARERYKQLKFGINPDKPNEDITDEEQDEDKKGDN